MTNSLQIYLPQGVKSIPHRVKTILNNYEISSTSQLPDPNPSDQGQQQVLILDDGAIKLKHLSESFSKFNPIYIDFEKAWMHHFKSFESASISKELLAKAIGIGKIAAPIKIIDLTCGMAKDSILMLFFKTKVLSIERSPWVSVLIEDAISKALDSDISQLVQAISENFQFIHGDSADLLPQIFASESDNYDVAYLDPMYATPANKRKALPNKNMQIFHQLVGVDNDSNQLFNSLRSYPLKRIVVKRSLNAPELCPEPTHSYQGKSTRYDMYFLPSLV